MLDLLIGVLGGTFYALRREDMRSLLDKLLAPFVDQAFGYPILRYDLGYGEVTLDALKSYLKL